MKAAEVHDALREAAGKLGLEFKAEGKRWAAVGDVQINLRHHGDTWNSAYDHDKVERILVRAGDCAISPRHSKAVYKLVNVTKKGELPLEKVIDAIKEMTAKKIEDRKYRSELKAQEEEEEKARDATVDLLERDLDVSFAGQFGRRYHLDFDRLRINVRNSGNVDLEMKFLDANFASAVASELLKVLKAMKEKQ
jgi:hypothetical protein